MLGSVASGFAAQGMTASAHSIGYKTEVSMQPISKDQVCTNLRAVEINVAFAEPPTIYIASEIPVGSCRYNSTLAHERQHVSFATEASETVVVDLQNGLGDLLASRLPLTSANAGEAQQLSLQMVKDAVEPVAARHMAGERLKNLAIDSQASYEALSAECPGE